MQNHRTSSNDTFCEMPQMGHSYVAHCKKFQGDYLEEENTDKKATVVAVMKT